MADHDAAQAPTNGHRLLTPESRSRASYETGESSATGSLRDATPSSSDRRLLEVPRTDDLPRSLSPDYDRLASTAPIPRGRASEGRFDLVPAAGFCCRTRSPRTET
ncbi:hypothetical protein ACCO45_006892 [Purpureocillium lilacinum]|uniref:Uncharacterized protein n=1 Tax=Purpureocillium lilacinum TaxID=33203 RepID=A0ACC4DTT8_PURLI